MSDHPNSLSAYDRSEENGANRRIRYYKFVLAQGDFGATEDEVIIGAGIEHQSVGACRHDLLKLGALVDTGTNRETRSKRKARVWEAVPGIEVSVKPPRTEREELMTQARRVLKAFTDAELRAFVEEFSEQYDDE